MARKMKSVDLCGAWVEFWPILFPEMELQSTLRQWVHTNLVSFNPQELHTIPALLVGPEFAAQLSIDASPKGARVFVGNVDLGHSPWFSTALIEHSPQWVANHPLERLAAPDPRNNATSRSLTSEGAKLVRNVTLRVGAYIRRSLEAALRDRKLVATWLSAADGFASRREVTAGQIQLMTTLDFLENRIALPSCVVLNHVEIYRNPEFKDNMRKGGSLEEADRVPVELMHKMIAEGGMSRNAAAKAVYSKAGGRDGSDETSVIKRLLDRYRRRYGPAPKHKAFRLSAMEK